MATTIARPAVGAPLTRIEAREKVTGQARYAYEHSVEGVVYAAIVQADIALGRVTAVDAGAAAKLPGVLALISHENAPRLEQTEALELAVLQSDAVAYRGQIVAAVVAETLEVAEEAASVVRVAYEPREHDVQLRLDHPRIYAPDKVVGEYPTDTELGDPDAALAASRFRVDATYETPACHNNPIEPHASIALWHDGNLTVYDSTQGTSMVRATLAGLFGLEIDRVRVISPHVGGGFGSKASPRPSVVLAALAARVVGRPVKLAVTRQQMFAFVGYRTPTIQRVRLGAGSDGALAAIVHDVLEQSSTLEEFVEQTATPTRVMYAAANRRTTHRLVRLDVPTPSWMRAPGECPGLYALECAMDELAIAAQVDPVELRLRNEATVHPENGKPFSSRNLVACLNEGAERFGWAERDPTPGARRDGRWLVGAGVASSTYPAYLMPSRARARVERDGGYAVSIAASDVGQGARTALAQIAADALGVPPERVRMEIGDSALPMAPLAGASWGTASWGSAVARACEALRRRLEEHDGPVPPEGFEVEIDTSEEVAQQADLERQAFGAQFAEVRVDPGSGEVRVSRMLGVFAIGRVLNPRTARSQLIGGMTMGISMALHEESILDVTFGDYLNRDFAGYHVATCADVEEIEADWIDERDDQLNAIGTKGAGEIGIVGAAAAIANAVHHATGIRVRALPIQPHSILPDEVAQGMPGERMNGENGGEHGRARR